MSKEIPRTWSKAEIAAYGEDPLVPEMNMLVSMAERIKKGEFRHLTSVWVARRDEFIPETHGWETWVYEVNPMNKRQVAGLVKLAADWEKNKYKSKRRNKIDMTLQSRMKKIEPEES